MTRPYGTWPSPISAEHVASRSVRLGAVAVDGDDVYWIEGRPQEGGRNVLVRRRRDGSTADVVPEGFNVRSRVHEYGGGAYVVDRGNVYFSNFADQRIYRVALGNGDARPPVPITPEGKWFYADYAIDRRRDRLLCVREQHSSAGEAVNTLVSIPLSGGSAGDVIAAGHDFYSTPRLSPDGSQLSWLAWRHPNMPWDGTELWIADVADDGALSNARRIAGSDDESIYQPGWGPDGRLYFVSDREGWWRVYRSSRSGRSGRSSRSDRSDRSGSEFEPVLKNAPADAEFGRPQWVFGTATWVFVAPARMLTAYTLRGRWFLADVDTDTGDWRTLDLDLEPHDWMAVDQRQVRLQADTTSEVVLVAASPTRAAAVVRLDVASGRTDVLRASSSIVLNPGDVSLPTPMEFPTAEGETAHALHYPPTNSRIQAAPDERPPLIAISHGGPTAAATATLDLTIQFWTSRGFAVVDVNYRGSSGFGRQYRNRLRGQWGIADVDDMVHAVRHLVASGHADESRLIIRGGSAGGYTTLAALTFQPGVFKAAASYYGISDVDVLARDTHKFEARYLDRLIGPYPEARDQYRDRSPIHFVDRLACPIILLQGLEDRVVPPNQSAMMADAARAKGLPVAYLTFEGEQHGFRKAETIVRSLEAELYFYGAVYGFTPSDPLPAIHIDNLSPAGHGDTESRLVVRSPCD
jgi:dipeptidyl aminopeptidase/acylaminoacyl peptidase